MLSFQEKWTEHFMFPEMNIISIKPNNSIIYNYDKNKSFTLFSTINEINFVCNYVTVLYNVKILETINDIKKGTEYDIVIITKIDNLIMNNDYHIKLMKETTFDTFNVDYISIVYKFSNSTIKCENMKI
jgi:hypothetical protein